MIVADFRYIKIMAKEIKFNIKLNIDGKEQLVSATSTVENLRGVVNAAKSDIQKANAVFVNFNQQVMKLQNINGAVQQLASTLSSVTEESRTFGAAMNVANTMAGKGGDIRMEMDDFKNMDISIFEQYVQVGKKSKSIETLIVSVSAMLVDTRQKKYRSSFYS